MSASTTDKITDVRNNSRPNSARVITSRAIAGTTLHCNSLTGWPIASKVHFVTYQIDGSNNPIDGTQLDCYGIVSGADIGSFTVLDGTDGGNSVGDVVEMLPTAAWGQDLAEALGATLNRDGSFKSDIVDNAQLVDNSVHTEQILDDAVTAPKLVGLDKSNLTTDSNPYKFHAYSVSNYSATGQTFTKITMNGEVYDTNNNFDSTTNYRYVAPVSGFYLFMGSVQHFITPGYYVIATIYKNGVELMRGSTVPTGTTGNENVSAPVVAMIQLTAGDYVELWQYDSQPGAYTVNGTLGATFFQGFLISRT